MPKTKFPAPLKVGRNSVGENAEGAVPVVFGGYINHAAAAPVVFQIILPKGSIQSVVVDTLTAWSGTTALDLTVPTAVNVGSIANIGAAGRQTATLSAAQIAAGTLAAETVLTGTVTPAAGNTAGRSRVAITFLPE